MSSPQAQLAVTVVGCGVLGLLIGSFLNVVVYRVPRHLSIVSPGSHCPRCQHELSPAENIPVVSWLVLRGRCRACHQPISPRYPAIELGTAAVFVALAWAEGPHPALLPLLVTAAAALAAGAIGVDRLSVPWPVAGAALVGAVGLIPVALVAGGEARRLAWGALGALLASGGAALAARGLRSTAPGLGPPEVAVAASLGWSAGWLWPPGGPVVAGWSLLVAVLAWRGTPGVRRWTVALVVCGGLAVVVLGAAVGP